MRRKDREVTYLPRIKEIINASDIIRIGFCDAGEVYIVPVNFGFEEEGGKITFYFHGAGAGRKYELSKNGCEVGFELEAPSKVIVTEEPTCRSTCLYSSVMGNGYLSLITENPEKIRALNIIMRHYSDRTEFNYEEKLVESVAVFKLSVKKFSAKEKIS